MAHNFLYITIILYVPLTPLPEGRGAVGGPDDEDALAVTAGVSVDDDGDVHVTAADVSVDAVTVDAVTAAVAAAVTAAVAAAVTAAVTAAVSVDAGADVVLAVVVDADADVDADVVTIVVTVDTMLQLVILAIEKEFVELLLDFDLQTFNGILSYYQFNAYLLK